MDLFIFHRVLIGAAILFDVFFTTFCIRKYNINGDSSEIVMAVCSSVIVVGLVVYLVIFGRKTARLMKLREQMEKEKPCPKCGYNLQGSAESSGGNCPECGHGISKDLRERVLPV